MYNSQQEPIAIIGIGCRFPGADNPDAFWKLLCDGRNAIREVPAERWKLDDIYDPEPAQPGKTVSRWGGFLDQIDQFDWRAFHLLPREVRQMDPQQRLLLEVAWEALEDAGLPFEQIAGSDTSVSIGISWNDYFRMLTQNRSQLDAYSAVGNGMGFAANRLSYAFDFKGSSVSIDTGCTSSLISVYQACQNLWSGVSQMALAGGVNLMLSPDLMIMLSQADFLSRDGQCKTLDERADGFVRGEGAGIVVLKLLSQVKASDRVYALIRGIATNHNGHNKWIVASSREAQESLLRATYSKAGIDPADIDYVELNGTAFLQGDVIETEALGAVLSDTEQRTRPCLIGSVKTNLGHLEPAAGIAGLIKVALSLHHQQIPPTLNLQTLNPGISLQRSHLAVQQELTPWPEKVGTPLAGVTALSMSGSNAHAVLAAYPICSPEPEHIHSTRLLPISAQSAEALIAQVAALYDFLSKTDSTSSSRWRDICYTAGVRRTHHAYRLALTASTAQEAASALKTYVQQPLAVRRGTQQKMLFLCASPGKSEQAMIEDPFLLANPAYQATIKECDHVVRRLTQHSLTEAVQSGTQANHQQRVGREVLSFVQQVALAALWRSWNVLPAAVFGEGLGELAAACIAGVLTLEEALTLLLAVNEPGLSTTELSFPRLARIPLCSYYTSLPGSRGEDVDLLAWARQLPDAHVPDQWLSQVSGENITIVLDLGLPSVLAERIEAHFQAAQRVAPLLSSFLAERDVTSALIETLGALYMRGHTIQWSALYTEGATCVSLPTYQWQRERLWPAWLDEMGAGSAPEPESQVSGEPAGEAEDGEDIKKVQENPPALIFTHSSNYPVPDLEVQLLNLWHELLGIEQIGPSDNFFALGGSSLLVGQLLARVWRLFQVKLSVTAIFEHPTIAGLAELIKQSSPSASDESIKMLGHKSQQYDEQLLAIVDYLTNEELSTLVGRRETLARLLQTKISGQKMFPLSFAQRRLWFLDQLQNGSPVYHVVVAYRISGELNSRVLERSLNEIVRRHDTLRTTFPAIDGQPMQIIAPQFTVEIGRENLEMLSLEQQTTEMQRLATDEVKKPFDLAQGPLMRTHLLRLNASEHVLLLNVHHIIFDGWSMGVFYRELAELYEAFTHSRPAPLPELPIQYLDYTVWERKWLQDEAQETSLAYWKQQLADAPAALELPTDYPRPPLETFRGAYEEFILPSSLVLELKKIGQQEQVTLFMVLLTAFQILLAYHSQQDDIVVGTDAANRGQVEIEHLIGFFVNQLVMRTNLSGDPTLSELLQRVRQVVLGAYEHQNVPFDQLVRALNPVRFPDRAPIFQVKMVLQNIPILPAIYAVTIDPLLVDAGAAQLDLLLDLTETATGLRALWQYNTDLFTASSINRMQRHFSALLQAFVASPSSPLSTFNTLLDQMEGQLQQRRPSAITDDFVLREQSVLNTVNLARALEEQAERTPHKVALIMQGREITYAELNAQANRLARRLKRLGVQSETMVVLCTERSLETIIGFFAIFKAGGVCVSLDPAYPKERWAFIVQDSQSVVAVTQSQFADIFSAYGLAVVDVEITSTEEEEEENLPEAIMPEQLAYVMYTSGSTGQPKGVAVSHQAALTHCSVMQGEFKLCEQDRIMQFYSLAFDGSLEQFFPGLFCGATIVMRGPHQWSITELNTAVREQKLTVMNLTPSLWQQWSQELLLEPQSVLNAQLRLIIVGAEAMTPAALLRWQKTPLATCRLINAYGPTEAVITAITFDVPEQFSLQEGSHTIPIGHPLPYREVYILNTYGKQVFGGSAGELYIGGPLLARGYLNRPDLTAERFVPDPFSAVPGSRLYRTGDRARYLPDGTIEYLGRVDQQVKIRGFRVELGEIETVLQQHSSVQTALVVAREDTPGEKCLVAYLLLQHAVALPELRGFLEDRLPAYMLPTAYICLDTLPLTANGKIDLRALPAPEAFHAAGEEIFVAPRTPTEEALTKIWREVLALEQIGIHDNFFASGGHSLLAIQIIARVRATFQVDLPVHLLFLEPTVAQFAIKILAVQGASQELALPAITRRRRAER